MPSGKDALKFFHAYINEMISIGGDNLPRSIAIRLGGKLAQLYKSRGITNLEEALLNMYQTIGGKTKMEKLTENEYHVITKHSDKFCPIGGAYSPDKKSQFLEIVCLPYTIGMLREFCPDYDTQKAILSCVIQHGGRVCEYKMRLVPKGSSNDYL